MTDELLRGLREELAAIRTAAADPDGLAKDDVALRITALFRRVEALASEINQFREEVRVVAERHRSLPRGAVLQDRLGASTFIEKGWHLISVGDYVGASRALRRALELAPSESQAGALLGWAQMLQGRLDEALDTLSGVLERDPANALARVNVGYIGLQKRNFGEAIEHLSRVIREDSDRRATLYAHHYLGLVYLERAMYDDAAGLLARAVELGPNLIEARYELGRALWFAGRRDEGRAAWLAGADAGSASPWSRRCRQLLELVEVGGEVPRSSLP